MLRVSLPFLLPTILSTATILMIVGMLAFDVPAVIGMPGNVIVMSAEIFRFMNPPLGRPEYGLSAALNSSLFVAAHDRPGALSAGSRAAPTASRPSAARATRRRAFRSAAGGCPPLRSWPVYFLLAVVLPFLALIWASLDPVFLRLRCLAPQQAFARQLRRRLQQRAALGRDRQRGAGRDRCCRRRATVLALLDLLGHPALPAAVRLACSTRCR